MVGDSQPHQDLEDLKTCLTLNNGNLKAISTPFCVGRARARVCGGGVWRVFSIQGLYSTNGTWAAIGNLVNVCGEEAWPLWLFRSPQCSDSDCTMF